MLSRARAPTSTPRTRSLSPACAGLFAHVQTAFPRFCSFVCANETRPRLKLFSRYEARLTPGLFYNVNSLASHPSPCPAVSRLFTVLIFSVSPANFSINRVAVKAFQLLLLPRLDAHMEFLVDLIFLWVPIHLPLLYLRCFITVRRGATET